MKSVLANINSKVKIIQADSLFELYALEKPVSILSHPNGANGDENVKNSLINSRYNYKDEVYENVKTDGSNKQLKPIHLINRLDSATSGVILVSTSKSTTKSVKYCFSQRSKNNNNKHSVKVQNNDPFISKDDNEDSVSKVYYAITFIKEPSSTSMVQKNKQRIQDMIGREVVWTDYITVENKKNYIRAKSSPSSSNSTINSVSNKTDSSGSSSDSGGLRESISKVTVLESVYLSDDVMSKKFNLSKDKLYGNLSFALLKLEPITGCTHQLRYQCQAHGFPIIGDKVYGDFKKNKQFTQYIRDSFKMYQQGEDNKTTPVSSSSDDSGDVSSKSLPTSSTSISSSQHEAVTAAVSFNRLYLHSHSINLSFDTSRYRIDNDMTTTSSTVNNTIKKMKLLTTRAIPHSDDNNNNNNTRYRNFKAVSPLPATFLHPVLGFEYFTSKS